VTTDLPAQRESRVGAGLRRDQERDSSAKYHASGDACTDKRDGAPVRLSLKWPSARSIDGAGMRFTAEFRPPKAVRTHAKCFFRGVVNSIH